MNKIKILHVVGKMDPGGIETLLMNIYRNIDRKRYEFHFAVQYPESGFYDQEIEEAGWQDSDSAASQKRVEHIPQAIYS